MADTSFLFRSTTGFVVAFSEVDEVDADSDANANDEVDAEGFVNKIVLFNVFLIVSSVRSREADKLTVVEDFADVETDAVCFLMTGVWSGVIGNTGFVIMGLLGSVSNDMEEEGD